MTEVLTLRASSLSSVSWPATFALKGAVVRVRLSELLPRRAEHWLVGAGAGKVLMGYPHSHNLVIGYFKGIGLFGALAIAVLCLVILARAGRWTVRMLRCGGDATDARILGCYMSAVVYVLANKMSDSFGPSTIGFLWTVYLAAVAAGHG